VPASFGLPPAVAIPIRTHPMSVERSLILLKPDCLESGHSGEVMARFAAAGFGICGAKMIQLNNEILNEHYAHLTELPFFPEIVAFMQSSPVLALILEGEDAVGRIRGLLGPTDSTKAPAGTIRGDLGTSSMKNIAHASDSPENAQIEINRFFAPDEVF